MTGSAIGSVWTIFDALRPLTRLRSLDLLSPAYDSLFRAGLARQQRMQAEAYPPPVAVAPAEATQPRDDVVMDDVSSASSEQLSEPPFLDSYEYTYTVDQGDHEGDEPQAMSVDLPPATPLDNLQLFEEPLEVSGSEESEESEQEDSDRFGLADEMIDSDEEDIDEFEAAESSSSSEDSDEERHDPASMLPLLGTQHLPTNPTETASQSIRRLLALSDYLRDLVRNRSAPLCRRPHYRPLLIFLLPQLETIDRRAVTDSERAEALQIVSSFLSSPLRPVRSIVRSSLLYFFIDI